MAEYLKKLNKSAAEKKALEQLRIENIMKKHGPNSEEAKEAMKSSYLSNNIKKSFP